MLNILLKINLRFTRIIISNTHKILKLQLKNEGRDCYMNHDIVMHPEPPKSPNTMYLAFGEFAETNIADIHSSTMCRHIEHTCIIKAVASKM